MMFLYLFLSINATNLEHYLVSPGTICHMKIYGTYLCMFSLCVMI